MFKIFISIICALGLIIFAIFLAGLSQSKAQVDNVALHIRTEVSSDNGQTWLNYSGTENPRWEALCPNSGPSTLLVRTKMWNTSQVDDAVNVTGTSTLTNYNDCANNTYEVNANTDGDQVAYSNLFFTGPNQGTISMVPLGGSENNVYEGQTTGIRTCANYNPCDYPITGTATINNYTPQPRQAGFLDSWIGKAFATGNGYQSTFQIGGDSCQVCRDRQGAQTSVQTSTESTLPGTGQPIIILKNLLKNL